MSAEPFTLPGEGAKKLIERTRVRIECGNCGEPATKRHSYMLPDARVNPASSGYRRDDISWCSDHDEYTCPDCPEPRVDGYYWGSMLSIAPDKMRFGYMFLRWDEREIAAEQVQS